MIDPKLNKCVCGYSWHFNKLDYIKMIIFGKVIVRCPQCHQKHYYILIYHAVREYNKTSIENKQLEKTSKRLWGNA